MVRPPIAEADDWLAVVSVYQQRKMSKKRRLRFRISMQFLLGLTLLVAFFFLGWSSHQHTMNNQYQRAQFTAKKIQDQWFAETEMIRQATETRPARSGPVDGAAQLIESATAKAAEKDRAETP